MPTPLGESRWPMALAVVAVVAVMLLSLFQSSELSTLPTWVAPAYEGVLLVALIWADPGRIDRQTHWIRYLSLLLVGSILVSALTSTVLLGAQLRGTTAGLSDWAYVEGSARVWLTIIIAFALLYWQLDSGGPVTRLHRPRRYRDFLFPQQAGP